MTRDQWVSRAYAWGCGFALGVPVSFAFLLFVFVPHEWISPLAFLILMVGAVAWASGCFMYGIYCVERGYQQPPG
jgi:hypothetical protein